MLDSNWCSLYNKYMDKQRMGVPQLYYKLNCKLVQLNEKMITVHMEHKIYGKQKAKCIFHLVQDKDKIGFIANGSYIYLYINEIQDVFYSQNCLKIVGNLQTITLKEI